MTQDHPESPVHPKNLDLHDSLRVVASATCDPKAKAVLNYVSLRVLYFKDEIKNGQDLVDPVYGGISEESVKLSKSFSVLEPTSLYS